MLGGRELGLSWGYLGQSPIGNDVILPWHGALECALFKEEMY